METRRVNNARKKIKKFNFTRVSVPIVYKAFRVVYSARRVIHVLIAVDRRQQSTLEIFSPLNETLGIILI